MNNSNPSCSARNEKSHPKGWLFLFLIEWGGFERPALRSRVKSVRWTLFRPWENPWPYERTRMGVGVRSFCFIHAGYVFGKGENANKSLLLCHIGKEHLAGVLFSFMGKTGLLFNPFMSDIGENLFSQMDIKENEFACSYLTEIDYCDSLRLYQ